MTGAEHGVESQIEQWRAYVRRRPAITDADVDELEAHLREQVADLTDVGLAADEAFLVAVKRMGNIDAISHEFAREHSERLWKQLVLLPDPGTATARDGRRSSLGVALALAVGAAIALRLIIELPDEIRAVRNGALCVLPFLAAYFAWSRRLTAAAIAALVVAWLSTALVVNLYPFEPDGSTWVLVVIHTPVVLWFGVGVAYAAVRWQDHRSRMDFVRFTGEWAVYYFLLAAGGGALVGLTIAVFESVDVLAAEHIVTWVLPLGAGGAVLVAAWLVEAKQDVIENILPVLTRVFTPLTLAMLLAALGAFATSPDVLAVNRELLIVMALILVLVLGLLLYAISARDPLAPAGPFDALLLAVVVTALVVDAVVLVAMLSRIAEFGASPNKVAALGLNLVIAVNLVRSAILSWRFVRGRGGFAALERWQTTYLPVYGAWAAVVVVALPVAFGFD